MTAVLYKCQVKLDHLADWYAKMMGYTIHEAVKDQAILTMTFADGTITMIGRADAYIAYAFKNNSFTLKPTFAESIAANSNWLEVVE